MRAEIVIGVENGMIRGLCFVLLIRKTVIDTFLLRSLLWLLSLLPLALLRAVAAFMGSLLWRFGGAGRKVIDENLRICFPAMSNAERDALSRQRSQQLCMMALELGAAWTWPQHKLMAAVTSVEGEEVLDAAVAAGKGVVIMAPHHGNWEILAAYLASSFKLTSLYQPPKIAAIDKIVLESRLRYGTGLATTDMRGVKTLLKALKKNEMVGILPDQVPPAGSGEFAPFFNTPALTMTLVYNLVQRTVATVVTSYVMRDRLRGGFKVVFREPPVGLYSAELPESLAALNQSVEQVVADCPEQYQWEYKRFKKQPEGAKKFYR